MITNEFKYSWRFTDEKYALFTNDELNEMNITSDAKKAGYWNSVCDDPIIEKCSFIKKIIAGELPVLIADCGWGDEASERDTEKVLRKHFKPEINAVITVLYDKETSLDVSSELFCNKWSDFCYPSDVLLINCNGQFFLYNEDTIYILDKQ